MSTQKERALDIFQVLDRINQNDFEFYATLTDEQKKSFQPYVAMLWMLGTSNKKQIARMNSRVNQYAFALGNNHKQLLYMLMASCTDGRSQRYTWTKLASKGSSKSHSLAVLMECFNYNEKRAKEVLHMFSLDEILELAQYLGKQTDELTKIKSEHKSKPKT